MCVCIRAFIAIIAAKVFGLLLKTCARAALACVLAFCVMWLWCDSLIHSPMLHAEQHAHSNSNVYGVLPIKSYINNMSIIIPVCAPNSIVPRYYIVEISLSRSNVQHCPQCFFCSFSTMLTMSWSFFFVCWFVTEHIMCSRCDDLTKPIGVPITRHICMYKYVW